MSDNHSAPRVEAGELAPTLWPPFAWLAKRPRLIDWVIVLLCTGLQRIALLFAGDPAHWTAYLTLGITALALLWRRRYPMSTLVTVVTVASISTLIHPDFGYQSVPFAFALYTVASRQSFARAAIGYGIGVAIPVAAALSQAFFAGSSFSPAVLDPVALIAFAVGIAVRNQHERRVALAELVNQRLENAKVTERTRITAEMHDVVAHSISVMIALANGASTAWQKHPERAATALTNLSTVGRTALLDMRRILHLLRDNDADLADALHQSGHNLPALEELIDIFRSAGLPVTLTKRGEPLPEDTALTMAVYRIVQESLTNCLRYSVGATSIQVELDVDDAQVEVTTTDNGTQPAGPSIGSGHGLVSIAERAATYNGSSAAGPRPGGGWQTSALLRFEREAETAHD